MNQRHAHNLFDENIKLKREKQEQEKKFEDTLSDIFSKISDMSLAIEDLKNRHVTVTQFISKEPDIKLCTTSNEKEIPMFIPSMDQNSLKSSISDIQKVTRKSTLEDSLKELSKLQKKS